MAYRRYQRFPAEDGKYNSLWYWNDTVNPFKVIWNFIVISICRIMPSLRLKNKIYRMLGVNVGEYASVGLMVMLDVFFPEQIEIGENVIIGYNTTILGHEYLQNEWRIGKVIIGRNVLIGANSTILPGVTIGEGAVVSAMSLVNCDIPPYTFYGGVPAKEVMRR